MDHKHQIPGPGRLYSVQHLYWHMLSYHFQNVYDDNALHIFYISYRTLAKQRLDTARYRAVKTVSITVHCLCTPTLPKKLSTNKVRAGLSVTQYNVEGSHNSIVAFFKPTEQRTILAFRVRDCNIRYSDNPQTCMNSMETS